VNSNLRSIIYTIPFVFLSLLFVCQSCKKDINAIGLDLKERDDLLNAIFSDTTTLIAYSVLEDTLNTTNLVSNYLGYLKDHIFGTTTSCIYTQFIPEGNSFTPGNAPVLDSIVLTLRYSGDFYGDTLNPFIIKVYELTEDILPEKTYYQNNSIAYSPNNLTYVSEFNLYPKPNTEVMVDTLKDAHLRIRLCDELGNRFLTNTEQLQTPEKFKSFFKGLFIRAESFQNNGSLVNFSLTSALSGIQIYYKNGGEKKQFSLIIRNPDAVRFNTYQHDYENGDAQFVQQVLNNDTTKGKEILYMQSMGGVKTKISFPFIKALKEKENKIVINKAELIIECIGGDQLFFSPPGKLGIHGVNKDGKTVYIPDDVVFTNESYWGGNALESEYRFRITRYIQNIIHHDNYQSYIFLVTDRSAADAKRLLINGTEGTTRLRLDLYYTEY